MPKNSSTGDQPWTDPDDAPELTQEWFDRADYYIGDKLIRRGRPKSEHPKQQISVRLDMDVLERLRAFGPGWQTRMNAMLRQALDQSPNSAPSPSPDQPR